MRIKHIQPAVHKAAVGGGGEGASSQRSVNTGMCLEALDTQNISFDLLRIRMGTEPPDSLCGMFLFCYLLRFVHSLIQTHFGE